MDSNHRLAERRWSSELDLPAFEPRRKLQKDGELVETFLDADGVAKILINDFKGKRHAYPVVRVIGNDPLRQFLISAPGGRLQTCDASYDPRLKEWFDVYEGDPRKPGDWGHWTGQGMNWNAMCASCHNTRLRKNYDPRTNHYHTTMAEMSVGCEACHGPMKAHVDWQTGPDRESSDPTLRDFSKKQMMETCGACHSRRMEVTGDLVPGESYFDHFSLTVPDGTDLYYPDGQVREENYVFSSFLSSGMHHAGVSCGDCHEPHSNRLLVEGNLLCMRCHAGGTEPAAPVIDPARHSPCTPGTDGHDCKSCHMPQTTYMQRHPRRDHGFTIPDPWLTKEYGVPNACNRCHADRSTDWALEKADSFYGKRLDRPTRHRAIVVARARAGDRSVLSDLLEMARSERIELWRATACHLMEPWVFEPIVSRVLLEKLRDDSPLVREAACRVLTHPCRQNVADVRNVVHGLLSDPIRSVRVAAAWALVDTLDLSSKAGRELTHVLDINADQPTGRMRLGQFAYLRGKPELALRQIRKAIEWDPNSPAFHHDLAILLNLMGDGKGSIQALERAIKLDPLAGEYHYKLALALAEGGDRKNAVEHLETCVRLDPSNARAWYNLGLALHAIGSSEKAVYSLRRAEALDPGDASIPYARATIHARLGQREDAMQAALSALKIRPDHSDAARLLRSMR